MHQILCSDPNSFPKEQSNQWEWPELVEEAAL